MWFNDDDYETSETPEMPVGANAATLSHQGAASQSSLISSNPLAQATTNSEINGMDTQPQNGMHNLVSSPTAATMQENDDNADDADDEADDKKSPSTSPEVDTAKGEKTKSEPAAATTKVCLSILCCGRYLNLTSNFNFIAGTRGL